jgi:hypothetical protein
MCHESKIKFYLDVYDLFLRENKTIVPMTYHFYKTMLPDFAEGIV